MGMESGHDAAPFIEGANGIDTARETNVQVQRARRQVKRVLAQVQQRLIVAGVQRDHVRAVVKCHRKSAFQFVAQRLNLRCKARLSLSFSPHQLVGKFGQSG